MHFCNCLIAQNIVMITFISLTIFFNIDCSDQRLYEEVNILCYYLKASPSLRVGYQNLSVVQL